MAEGTPDPPADDRTFTQTELDRIVQDRLARERAKYGDYDDLKAKAGRLDELEASQKTELEKAQETARQAEERARSAEERARAVALRAAVVAEAARVGVVDPDAVAALLPADAVTVADDGSPAGVAEAVAGLLDAKPYLRASTPQGTTTPTPGGADGGPRGAPAPGQLGRDDLKGMTPEEIVKAKSEGRLNQLLGVT
ncbi:MAG: phage scaffolding protein [Acidimicrobiales bacterium]|nr:phage scaffolding protein [Acidimicrobiales bacterium]